MRKIINKKDVINLKKYIVFLSIFFILIINIHLGIKYLYDDAIIKPDSGGVIEVGMIGVPPSLNPLRYKLDTNNDIILPFVFRPLLSYDLEQKKMIGDIANCDITYLDNIRCSINDNAKWNNGEQITSLDIISTYNFIKRTDINSYFKEILKDTEIREEEGQIVFESNTQDVLILEAFTVPIVHHSFIEGDEIAGNITDIASGMYSKASLSYDKDGNQIVTVDNISEGDHFIQKYIFRFYNSPEDLLENRKNLHIALTKPLDDFEDSRFNVFSYSTSRFYGVFLNSGRLSKSVRKIISFNIGQSIINNEDIQNKVFSPYFKETPSYTTEYNEETLEELLKKEGFLKKEELKNTESISIDDYNEIVGKNEEIYSPSNDKVWLTSSGNFLLSAKIPENVTSVYINDYKLQGFTFGDAIFNYRIKVTLDNLAEGENEYIIYYEKGGKKVEHEKIKVLYSPDLDKLKILEQEFLNKEKEENTKLKETELSRSSKFDSLNEALVYNKDLNNFSINIAYLNIEELKNIAELISISLGNDPVEVILTPLTLEELDTMITTGNKNYDILIAGVSANTGFVENNLFPFFHSGQAGIGYNFSTIKNLELDKALEKTKQLYSDIDDVDRKDQINEAQDTIERILKEEAVLVPISKPTKAFIYDSNINGVNNVEKLPSINYLHKIFEISYIFTTKELIWENKSLLNYINYLYSNLISSNDLKEDIPEEIEQNIDMEATNDSDINNEAELAK